MEYLSVAYATQVLLIANVVITLIGFSNRSFLNAGLLTVEGVMRRNEYWRLISSGFFHIGPLHLMVNMLVLFFFGPIMELILGTADYVGMYTVSLMMGSLAAVILNRDNPRYAALGASGAVSGVVFSFCLFAPFQMIYLFGILPMPAILFGLLYVLYSLYGMGSANSRVGHEAHLGGAIGGLVATIVLRPDAISSFFGELAAIF